MARDAFGLYTSEPVRNRWITFLDQYKDDTGKPISASGKANFHVAVVQFLKWIDDATGPILALGGRTLTPGEALTLSKVLKVWENLQRLTFKKAKDESIRNNTAEKFVALMPPGQLFKMRCILPDTAEPVLRELTEKAVLTAEEQVLYFNLLMYALMITRPCRPGTYAAWYVVLARKRRSPHRFVRLQ